MHILYSGPLLKVFECATHDGIQFWTILNGFFWLLHPNNLVHPIFVRLQHLSGLCSPFYFKEKYMTLCISYSYRFPSSVTISTLQQQEQAIACTVAKLWHNSCAKNHTTALLTVVVGCSKRCWRPMCSGLRASLETTGLFQPLVEKSPKCARKNRHLL